ncbi:outer membrane protein assembly factor [[Haemophilus] ducreyi]|uniref:Translocation and assembly module subunit TamA n=1 Tax=Haemophilus ducreyi (strain 35000HP / ATCC 700724) TaxID=233412 RepID=Q7VL30_HAEDU|nr:hypothetical protein HD_1655 [[Haemophilus] ducreyi 35000HP]ASE07079.1 outer membrane protein assembly factor [[Haemophilus] ducreyi]
MNFNFRFFITGCFLTCSQIIFAEQLATTSQQEILAERPQLTTKIAVDLDVKGIKEKDEDAWQNVQIYLAQINNEYADGSERYQYLVQTTVDKALRAKGYYNSQYQFVKTVSAEQKPLLTLNVQLDNQKVTIDEVDIQLQGDANTDEDFIELKKTAPNQGDSLAHNAYDDFKSHIEGLAFKKGYFDGQWLYHRLEVYPQNHSVDWRLAYDSGKRYRYGEINFIDNQIKEEYLTNILKIAPQQYYYASDLSLMTADYLSSNWFSSVLVEPKLNEKAKLVDLKIFFQPKKKNKVEIGAGFATQLGARLQLNWKKPWLNERGHSIDSRTYLSLPEQTLELGYNVPLRQNPLHYYYQFSGSLEHQNQQDTKSIAGSFGLQRFWTHETGWSFSAGIKSRYDSFTQANDKHKTLLVYPTAALNRTQTDGNRFPLWGDSQRITVNWGAKIFGSDVSFYSWKASSTWVRTYLDRHRLFLRGEVGQVHTKDFHQIPPTLRYFAGGDMSIRGFAYKSISPKEPKSGKLIGGSHLVTTTAEYQYRIYPDWWAAIFYDTGLVSDKFDHRALHSGAGVGVRWISPIGAIKFDIATPVKSPNNKRGVQFYIGLGSEL